MRPGALTGMVKQRSSFAGPMRTQPIQLGTMQPTLPLMPRASSEAKAKDRTPRKRLTRAQLIEAVKADISRRNSLRKQRAALKG
jgi:hypothetical protein